MAVALRHSVLLQEDFQAREALAGSRAIRTECRATGDDVRMADHPPATRKPPELGHTARAAKSVLVSVARYTAPNRLRLVWR